MQLGELQQAYGEFQEQNTGILAISNEDTERGSTLAHDLGLSYPILADSERDVIVEYGVFHQNEPKSRPISRPATFIIDGEGTIRYRYVGEDAADRPATGDLLAYVRDLNATRQQAPS